MRGLAERVLSFLGVINYSAFVVSHFHPYYIAGTQPEHLSPSTYTTAAFASRPERRETEVLMMVSDWEYKRGPPVLGPGS